MGRRDGGSRSPLVLHVVEAYGAGVAAVVHDYIASVPEVRHVVLAYRRPGAQLNERCGALFMEMPAGRAAQVRAVRLAIRTLQPDVIHAHSSYAGAYVRLAGPRSGARIVYSPHCYGFERRDLVYVCRPEGRELVVVTVWEEGENPAVPRRYTDALRRDDHRVR